VRGAAGAILATVVLALPLPARAAQGQPPLEAMLFVVDGMPYETALRDPALSGLARSGGVGLLTGATRPKVDATIERLDRDLGDTSFLIDRRLGLRPLVMGFRRAELVIWDLRGIPAAVPGIGAYLRTLSTDPTTTEDREILLMVMSAGPTAEMVKRGDVVTPLVLAAANLGELVRDRGPLHGLTSATTKRPGIVVLPDVSATIRRYLGRPALDEQSGSTIRIEGDAPTALHERFLEYRRIAFPLGVTALGIALAALLAGLVLLFLSGPAPPWLVRGVAIAGIFGVSLQAALLAGSWLPSFEPPVVWPAVLGVGAAVAGLALASRRLAPGGPVAVIAAAGLAFVLVDAVLGWPSLLTPLMGGSALEGARFFGLGNAYAGAVLAGSVLGAAFLRPVAGTVLIAAAGLFAGLPFLGADVGGALTLFAVAALWFGLRVRGRVGPGEVGLIVAAVVAGMALLVLTHRLWPVTEHLAEAASGGPGSVIEALGRRLALNARTTLATPAVWPALLFLPVGLLLAWRPVGPFRRLATAPEWRYAVAALAVGGILGYLANDTFGMASVAFLYVAAALVYPPLEARWTTG
jgi:hypothetical protein